MEQPAAAPAPTPRRNMAAPLKNSAVAFLCNILLLVGGFVLQRVMALALGQATIGMNGVFNNIISILSLAELGLSTAVVYHLYAPVVHGDEQTIAKLMRLYARTYRIIAAAVAGVGLLLLPFVHLFLKDSTFPLWYVRVIFGLFIVKSVSSYLLASRRVLLTADQKAYVLSIFDLVTQALSIGGGILILSLTGRFEWYLAFSVVCAALGNAGISLLVRKRYPYLRRKTDKPDAELKTSVFGNVRHIFVMRLSGVILNSTDTLIISSVVGVLAAGLYDNYYKVISAVLGVSAAVASAVSPTIGQLFVTEDKSDVEQTLRSCTFVFYLGASFCGVCLFCLLTPFVTGIWLSPQYEMPFSVVTLLVVNFFLIFLRQPVWITLDASGLFKQNRNTSIVGASLNLVVSLALVFPLGMAGVFIGTLVSQATQLVLKLRVLYRSAFVLSAKKLVAELIEYFVLFFALAAVSYLLCTLTDSFLLRAGVCILVPNAVNLAVFVRTRRFRRMRDVLGTLRRK